MFLIDGPYVSEFLKDTIYRSGIAVVRTAAAESFLDDQRTRFLSEPEALRLLQADPGTLIYTNSENALDWLYQQCPTWERVQTIQLVKDKILFREKLKRLHPEYQFSGHDLNQLHQLRSAELTFPLILKPAVGFFSLGVQRIENAAQWRQAMDKLDLTIAASENLYPRAVLDNSRFVLEQVIPGNEFAVDCYFDHEGQAVVLNIMQHLFASASHMNDRIYYTSGEVVREFLPQISAYLEQLGTIFKFTNFPAHIELRIAASQVQAIEVNPLRFGGWCSTADLAYHAWKMNLYELVHQGLRPDWEQLIRQQGKQLHALLVLDNSTDIPGARISAFDYEALLAKLSEPLELRPTDYRKFPVFGFLMCRVADGSLQELEELLHSDLREFLTLDQSG